LTATVPTCKVLLEGLRGQQSIMLGPLHTSHATCLTRRHGAPVGAHKTKRGVEGGIRIECLFGESVRQKW